MRYLKFLNIIFIILQASFFIGISAQLFFAENSFSELSQNLYGSDVPLMNSYLIELVANKIFSVVFFMISAIALYKNVIISNLKQRLLLNLALNIVHISIGTVLIQLLYSH